MVRGILLFLLLVVASPAGAMSTSTTLFLDGAIVEQEVAAPKGTVQVRLPAAMQPGSLRVRPLSGSVIEQVEVLSTTPAKSSSKGEAALMERKEQISDRLKALEAREEIFLSAAKSQSGKAPRKTKANPQPLATIRQGTEYALSQLEEVYRLRRKAERELKEVDRRLARFRQESRADESVARISVSGRRKGVVVTYHRSDLSWTPRYDFRLGDGGVADVTLKPKLPMGVQGRVFVVAGRLAEFDPGINVRAEAAPRSFRLPVEQVAYGKGPLSSLRFAVKNSGSSVLPAGEAACYWSGEYVGVVSFPGCGPGESREISAGAGNMASRQGTP